MSPLAALSCANQSLPIKSRSQISRGGLQADQQTECQSIELLITIRRLGITARGLALVSAAIPLLFAGNGL